MKLTELKDTIIGNDGSLTVGDLEFTYRSGEDVDVNAAASGLIAYVQKNADDEKDVAALISVVGDNTFQAISAQIRLAQYLGVTIPEYEPLTIERVVEKENTEAVKLAGKVEAYEKILIGREISASR